MRCSGRPCALQCRSAACIGDSSAPRQLGQDTKARLLEVLYEEVNIGGYKGPLMVGLHRTMASLVRCFAGQQKKLELPRL